MKNIKHLTYQNRKDIEECIEKRFHKSQIAATINKSPSTITKEIFKHRKAKPRDFYTYPNQCIHLKKCKICTKMCKDYEEQKCLQRDRYVGACNNCPNISNCRLQKYFYKSKTAHENYLYTLKDSREGVNLTTSELITIAHIIGPLLKQGQSPYTILQNHKEIEMCEKTLYTYIEMGLFSDWGITNFSLKKKKIGKKSKSKKLKKRNEPADYTGRKYEDYLEFIKEHPSVPTTEMDTVYNNQEGPYVQTFIFENTGFMFGILHREKTAKSMSDALNRLQDILEDDYSKLFSLLLTDRGSEFAKPQLFEINSCTGEIRGNIFYCDPQRPDEKPHVENNHRLVREILQKGKKLDFLTQEKLDLMFSHINSVPRKALGGKTPYEAFEFFYNKQILDKLNIQKIEKDKVTLQPYLLKIN